MVQELIETSSDVVIATVNNEFFICRNLTDYTTPKQMFANNGDEINTFSVERGATQNMSILGIDYDKSISDENGRFYEAIVFCSVVLDKPILS